MFLMQNLTLCTRNIKHKAMEMNSPLSVCECLYFVFLFRVDDPCALCTHCGEMEKKIRWNTKKKREVNERTVLKTLLHIYAEQQG